MVAVTAAKSKLREAEAVNEKPLIVIGIPAYNEERTIAKVVLEARKYADQVVVCDDGSSDMTGEIAEGLGAVVVRHERNLGYGAAIQCLFREAKRLGADVLVTLDADGQHDAEGVPLLARPILDGEADLVTGSRSFDGVQENSGNGLPWYRRLGVKAITRLTASASKCRVSDAQNGFRAYSRAALERLSLSENGMGVDVEVLVKAKERGLRFAEVPLEGICSGVEKASSHNPMRHGMGELVSVVIPSMDEEETIGVCIDKIRKVFDGCGIAGEIIVSDSSRDRTPIIAKDRGAKVIAPDEKGYGCACTSAFKRAKGEYVVIGDADDTYDFMEMPMLLEPLKKGEADFVIGSRLEGKMEKGAMPWHHRWIGNPVLTGFLNLFLKVGISDAHCGFRAIKREALEKLDLDSDGMEFASEMIMAAVDKGLRIKEVPISYYKRKNGNSKLSSFQDGWRHLKFMLMHAPDYLFVYPGMFLLFLGLFLMFSALLNVNLGYIPGAHSMVAGSLLTIAGYQAVFFGLFAKVYGGNSMPRFLTLERGATAGALMFVVGAVYVGYLVLGWVSSGFKSLPLIQLDILGLTFVALGIQTFFSSFTLSIIATGTKKRS